MQLYIQINAKLDKVDKDNKKAKTMLDNISNSNIFENLFYFFEFSTNLKLTIFHLGGYNPYNETGM